MPAINTRCRRDDLAPLQRWAPIVTEALAHEPALVDVSSDQQDGGLEIDLTVDRDTAARLGLKASQLDNTLYDAFGQRQVSTIYNPLNQYHVIMEVAPQFWQSPDSLKDIYVSSSGGVVSGSQATNALAGTVTPPGIDLSAAAGDLPKRPAAPADLVRNQATNQIANSTRAGTSTGTAVSTAAATMVPLTAISRFAAGHAPVSVNHQGNFVATTISFNLPEGVSLGAATRAIDATMKRLHVPPSIHGSFTGTANAYNQAVANEPLLILGALITVYLVLGILYESYVHPITILSTLPSAGIGALLALMLCGLDFSVMALIGIILLIGIVKKNGNHDDRCRPGSAAHGGPGTHRGRPSRLPVAPAADPDDHHGRAARRAATRHWPGRRRGTAPSARHRHRRRLDRQPAPDALHHSGHLSLSRACSTLGHQRLAQPASGRSTHGEQPAMSKRHTHLDLIQFMRTP